MDCLPVLAYKTQLYAVMTSRSLNLPLFRGCTTLEEFLQSSQGLCRTCIRPFGTRSIQPLSLGRSEGADTRQLERLHPALYRKLEQMFGQAGPHPVSSAVQSGRIGLSRKRR